MRRNQGFTIVELAITIVIIVILATVGMFSFVAIQKQARDSQREASALIVTSALEKYYDENGEYPGCESMTAEASIVQASTLKQIDTAALKAPNADNGVTNSILCKPLSSIPEDADAFSYSGDTSAVCLTGPACSNWKYAWRKEAGGEGEINSRRTAEAIATTPTVTATSSGVTSINTSWTSVLSVTSYQLQRSTTPGFSSPVTSTHTSRSRVVTGLTPNTTYYFRVRAALSSGGYSGWSNVADAKTANLVAPGGLTISATMSGENARGTAGGGSCVSGATMERQIRHQVNGGSWSSYVTGSPRDEAADEGSTHTFQQQARCTLSGHASPWTQSATASVTRGVSTPSDLEISATMSGIKAIGSATGGSCSSGTTLERQIHYESTSTNTAGSWSSWKNGETYTVAAFQGHRYTFQQQARCVGANTSSNWVTSATANTVRPMSAPSAPNVTSSTNSTSSTWSWGGSECPINTFVRYSYRPLSNYSGTFKPDPDTWYTLTFGSSSTRDTRNQGYRYGVDVRALCHTVHATSDWSSIGTDSFTRPVDNPGPITYRNHRQGSKDVRIYATSSCGPGATLYTRSDMYTADWSWLPRPPEKFGWYRTHFGDWQRGWAYESTNTVTQGTSSATVIPNGSRFQAAFEMRCRNPVTGVQSGSTGERRSSPMYVH